MAELNDNAIEFFSDSKTAWVTFSKKKFVNKIRKYAEERSDVEIISDNKIQIVNYSNRNLN